MFTNHLIVCRIVSERNFFFLAAAEPVSLLSFHLPVDGDVSVAESTNTEHFIRIHVYILFASHFHE